MGYRFDHLYRLVSCMTSLFKVKTEGTSDHVAEVTKTDWSGKSEQWTLVATDSSCSSHNKTSPHLIIPEERR